MDVSGKLRESIHNRGRENHMDGGFCNGGWLSNTNVHTLCWRVRLSIAALKSWLIRVWYPRPSALSQASTSASIRIVSDFFKG